MYHTESFQAKLASQIFNGNCWDECLYYHFCLHLNFFFRCDLMTRCWSQEPHNRPTFSCIHDKLQEIRHSPLSFICCLENREASTGVINEAFEGESGQHPLLLWPLPRGQSAFHCICHCLKFSGCYMETAKIYLYHTERVKVHSVPSSYNELDEGCVKLPRKKAQIRL